MARDTFPTHARVVIVGGGIMGVGVAYHLAQEGWGADDHCGEPVLPNGQVVGATTSVDFGHSVEKILAFTYLEPKAAAPGTKFDVVIAGQPRPAIVLTEPAHDPASRFPRTDATLETTQ